MSKHGRNVTIMLHRDGALASHKLTLPLWLARAVVVTASVIGALVVLGAILYAPIVKTAARVPGLNREVARLRSENEQVQELAATLTQVESRYEQVRTMLGGDIVPQRARSLGSQPVARPLVVHPAGAAPAYESGPSIPVHWPLDERGIITRGIVTDARSEEEHSGLDIAVPVGTPIRAAGGGVVRSTGSDPEYGFFVRIEHPDGYESMYGHASRLLVSTGDSVAAGEVIALSGSTGRSTAPHLHFEVIHDGRLVDPRTLLREEH